MLPMNPNKALWEKGDFTRWSDKALALCRLITASIKGNIFETPRDKRRLAAI